MRYKVIFTKTLNGIIRTSAGYYKDEADWKSRNNTFKFIKMSKISEKIKEEN